MQNARNGVRASAFQAFASAIAATRNRLEKPVAAAENPNSSHRGIFLFQRHERPRKARTDYRDPYPPGGPVNRRRRRQVNVSNSTCRA
jgi:hypothetical protein